MTTPLEPEELVFIGICDLSAQVRGKSVPAADLSERLAHGVGYTPANICFSPFGTIGTSPFGTLGDIVLLPDIATEVRVEIDPRLPEHFYLADIVTPDGKPWPSCGLRDYLRRALDRLHQATNCTLLASFEQEFVYTGIPAEPRHGYAHTSFREQGAFGALFVAALRAAGFTPDTFLNEFGPRQFEITVAPATGMRAADEAVILRELARAVAYHQGHRAIFAPMLESSNGRRQRNPHPPQPARQRHQPCNARCSPPLRPRANVRTIHRRHPRTHARPRRHHHSICLLLLSPHSQSLGAHLGQHQPQDRAASLRICPGPAVKFNVEYRVTDATACPYMALGALVHAGVDGIERKLSLPSPPAKPFTAMKDAERLAAGMKPLPRTLGEAIALLRSTPAARDWFGPDFFDLYLNFKLEEEQSMAGLEPQQICDRYATAF